MNRRRLAGATILAGVGLYLAGILLPYYEFRVSISQHRSRLISESALQFGNYAKWLAATPLVLMFVVTMGAVVILRSRRLAPLAGGAAAGIGAVLLIAFVRSLVVALHGRDARIGAILSPLGASMIAFGGVQSIASARGRELAKSVRAGQGIPSLVGGLGLLVAAFFTRIDAEFAAPISFNSDPLHWTRPSFWWALECLLIVVVTVLTVRSALRGHPSMDLVGAVGGFGLLELLRFGNGLGYLAAFPELSPGPGSYLGLGGGLLLLASAIILSRRTLAPAEESSPVSP